ncbi:acyl-CoA N-acyltransferase [Trichoderma austrokoningii]
MAQYSETILALKKSIVRRYRESDADAIVRGANTHLVSQYMTDDFPSPYTLESAERWIKIASEEEGTLEFAICTLDSNTVIGSCGLQHLKGVESRTKILGYWLSPDYWGQGIMTEVVAGLSRWIFEQAPTLLRLEASVVEENEGSMKVLKRVGYQYEGTRNMAVYKNGKISNVVLFGLTRDRYTKMAGERFEAGN